MVPLDQHDLHCVFVDLERAYDRVPREEMCRCMRDKGVSEKYIRRVKDKYSVPSMRNCREVCCRNNRNICSGSWPPPRIGFQTFPVCHHDGLTDGKHQKKHLGR